MYDGSDGSRLTSLGSLHATSAAYTGGLGLDVPFGRAALFVEGHFTRYPGGNRDVLRGIQGRATPLTIGFRL